MPSLHLLIVEDDINFCDWACGELKAQHPEWIISTAHDVEGGLNWLESAQAQDMALAIIDLHLQEHSGIDLIIKISASFPSVPMLVLTSVDAPEEALAAIRAGAQGYMLKNTISGELNRAVEQLRNGASPISPCIAQLVLQAFRQDASPRYTPPPQPLPNELLSRLTSRETEVFNLLSRGYSDKEVAFRLGIAPSTVDTHVRAVYKKLSIHSRPQLRNLLTKYTTY
jgi:DNA-binding NarL/FixJ family response regulator